MSDSKQYLNDFYQCIETETSDHRDHYLRIEKSLKLTIYSLDARDVLKVALKQMESYLPIFESAYPDLSWVREWFDAATEFDPWKVGFRPQDEIEDEELRHIYATITNLHLAFNSYMNENGYDWCKYLAFVSICGFRGDKLLHHWSIDDPQSWSIRQQIRQLEPTDVEEALYRIVQSYRWGQSCREYDKHLWRNIADDIKSIANL